ncbi:hypothetical protein PIB30_051209 [Stylosanthes scabra]|uniref:Uncharacterized protein n=1 Tax=Stylosanthes scabra TaxID=79078 RepID=A0ABU6ZGP3_9FABA|nr:hypothetical protein [Stylosanthes scabra]
MAEGDATIVVVAVAPILISKRASEAATSLLYFVVASVVPCSEPLAEAMNLSIKNERDFLIDELRVKGSLKHKAFSGYREQNHDKGIVPSSFFVFINVDISENCETFWFALGYVFGAWTKKMVSHSISEDSERLERLESSNKNFPLSDLDDLLMASIEVLRRDKLGITYKALPEFLMIVVGIVIYVLGIHM